MNRWTVLAQVRALHGVKGGGDLKRAQIAVCTIEKANGLINRMAAADVSDGYAAVAILSVVVSLCLLLRSLEV